MQIMSQLKKDCLALDNQIRVEKSRILPLLLFSRAVKPLRCFALKQGITDTELAILDKSSILGQPLIMVKTLESVCGSQLCHVTLDKPLNLSEPQFLTRIMVTIIVPIPQS